MRFTKMEGCGNDYIYINGFEEEVKYPDMLAVAMSERHFGVGADGLVLILPSEVADFRMRMFNNAKATLYFWFHCGILVGSIWTVPKEKCAATRFAASANMFTSGA